MQGFSFVFLFRHDIPNFAGTDPVSLWITYHPSECLLEADTEPDSWYVHDQRCLGSFEGLTPWPRTPSNPDLETNRLPRIGTVVGIISVFMQLQAVNRIVFLQST
jgi:hypothetical protein